MQPYQRPLSEVRAYNTGPNFIIVQFKSGDRYLFNHVAPGPKHVRAMKRLAADNEGLARYIAERVKKNYASRILHAGVPDLCLTSANSAQ